MATIPSLQRYVTQETDKLYEDAAEHDGKSQETNNQERNQKKISTDDNNANQAQSL